MILAIASLVIVSCSSPRVEQKPSDVKISWQVDTMFSCQEPVTKPRFSCNGQVLPDPKLIGMRQVQNLLKFQKDTIISADSLLKWGYVPVGKTATKSARSDFSWLWDILKWIGSIVLIVAGILFGLWLLRELFNFLTELGPSRRSGDTNITSRHSETANQATSYERRTHGDGGQNYQQSTDGGGTVIGNIENVEHLHIYVNNRRNRGDRQS